MARILTVLAVLAVLALVHVTQVRAQAPQQPAAGNASTGRDVFAKTGCTACHGPEGGGTAAAPALAGTALQLPAFVSYVRKPTGIMPPHPPQQISDQSLADVHAFLRSVAAAPPAAQGAAQAPPGRVDAGGALYAKVGCYQCHGNEGQCGLSGPRVAPNPIPYARFLQYVRHPTGEMPPYTEKVLSNQDVADIYAFVQARPQPPAVNTIPQLEP